MQSIQEKQTLLRNQIIDSGIDGEAFMEFIGTVKNEGENIDLDNWTIQELKDVVTKFKENLNKVKLEQQVRISRMMSSIISKKSKIFETKKEKVKYEGSNLWDYQVSQEQDCAISQNVFGIKPQLKPIVKIQKYQIKSVGGFLFGIGSRNQLQIVVKTNFTEQRVIRRGQDCEWLRNMIVLNHPGCYVPPLENEREFPIEDKKGIAARVNQIQRFLTQLMKYSVFHTSRFLLQFYTQESVKKFNQFKVKESSFAIQKDINQIETPTGKFTVQISEKINKVIKQSSGIAVEMNTLYSDLTICSNKVIQDMENIHKNIRYISDLCFKLGQKHNELQKILQMEDLKTPIMLESLNSTVAILTKNIKRHQKAFTDFSQNYIKSSFKQWSQMVAHDRRLQIDSRNYLYFKQNLLKKKQKWVNDPTKWELPESQFLIMNRKGTNKLTRQQSFAKMFPNDNQTQNRMRIWLSYVNQNYIRSYKQLLFLQESELQSKFLVYAGEYMCLNKQTGHSYESFGEMFIV